MAEHMPPGAILQQGRLFTIPPELRNRIYTAVLTIVTTDGKVDLIRTSSREQGTKDPSVLTLLLSCKQVKHEAEALFYHINHLQLCSVGQGIYLVPSLVRSLTAPRLESIRSLTIKLHSLSYIDQYEKNQLVAFLSRMTRLQLLQFDLNPKGFKFDAHWSLAYQAEIVDSFAKVGAKLDMVEDSKLMSNTMRDFRSERPGYVVIHLTSGSAKMATLESLNKRLSLPQEQRLHLQ